MERADALPSRLGRLDDAIAGAKESVRDAKARAESQYARHPYATLAAALGAGYVIGGGLFTPLTARVLGAGVRLGLRLAVLPLLQQELAATVQDAFGLGTPTNGTPAPMNGATATSEAV